jgi:hypothetical protein
MTLPRGATNRDPESDINSRTCRDSFSAGLASAPSDAHLVVMLARVAVIATLGLAACNGKATAVYTTEVEPAERVFTKAAGTLYPGELVAVPATCPEEMCPVSGGCSWGGRFNPITPIASMPELIGDEHVTTWTCSGMLDEFAEGPSSITAFAVCGPCDGEEVLALAE